jgi:hypothetical protein
MAKTIEQLLGLPALMGMVEETVSGLPQDKFLPKEFKTLTREVIGNSAQAVLTQGQRKVTKLIKYNSAPVGAPLEPIGVRDWVLFHSSEEIDIDPVTYQRLRQMDSWELQKQGAEEIGRQIGLFVKKSSNVESTTTLQALTAGSVYFDASGNLLPTSSGATQTVTIGMAADHQNQLAYPSSAIIDAPWSSPSTDIPKHIRNVKKAAAQSTGYIPEVVLYGENVPSYIMQNSFCKEFLALNPAMNQSMLSTGEIPDGFLGMTWVPAYLGFYEDYTGTNRQIVGADTATFMPKPSKAWYELVLGSSLIPTTLNPIMNVDSVMGSTVLKYGMFSYAHFEQKPIRLIVVQGHTWFPAVTNPNVLWQSKVANY